MQKFCKAGGELGYLKKRGGRSCKQSQGEHWKIKISFLIIRGERLTQGGVPPRPPGSL